MVNSTTTSPKAKRGPRPAACAFAAKSSGKVTSVERIEGIAKARFQTPIALAIALAGRMETTSAQSAVMNAPHESPAITAASKKTS